MDTIYYDDFHAEYYVLKLIQAKIAEYEADDNMIPDDHYLMLKDAWFHRFNHMDFSKVRPRHEKPHYKPASLERYATLSYSVTKMLTVNGQNISKIRAGIEEKTSRLSNDQLDILVDLIEDARVTRDHSALKELYADCFTQKKAKTGVTRKPASVTEPTGILQTCYSCGKHKDQSEFYFDSTKKKFKTTCKPCKRAKDKARQEARRNDNV